MTGTWFHFENTTHAWCCVICRREARTASLWKRKSSSASLTKSSETMTKTTMATLITQSLRVPLSKMLPYCEPYLPLKYKSNTVGHVCVYTSQVCGIACIVIQIESWRATVLQSLGFTCPSMCSSTQKALRKYPMLDSAMLYPSKPRSEQLGHTVHTLACQNVFCWDEVIRVVLWLVREVVQCSQYNVFCNHTLFCLRNPCHREIQMHKLPTMSAVNIRPNVVIAVIGVVLWPCSLEELWSLETRDNGTMVFVVWQRCHPCLTEEKIDDLALVA